MAWCTGEISEQDSGGTRLKTVSAGVIICGDSGVSDFPQFLLENTPIYATTNTIPSLPNSLLDSFEGLVETTSVVMPFRSSVRMEQVDCQTRKLNDISYSGRALLKSLQTCRFGFKWHINTKHLIRRVTCFHVIGLYNGDSVLCEVRTEAYEKMRIQTPLSEVQERGISPFTR
jgi:hypothetical protein